MRSTPSCGLGWGAEREVGGPPVCPAGDWTLGRGPVLFAGGPACEAGVRAAVDGCRATVGPQPPAGLLPGSFRSWLWLPGVWDCRGGGRGRVRSRSPVSGLQPHLPLRAAPPTARILLISSLLASPESPSPELLLCGLARQFITFVVCRHREIPLALALSRPRPLASGSLGPCGGAQARSVPGGGLLWNNLGSHRLALWSWPLGCPLPPGHGCGSWGCVRDVCRAAVMGHSCPTAAWGRSGAAFGLQGVWEFSDAFHAAPGVPGNPRLCLFSLCLFSLV